METLLKLGYPEPNPLQKQALEQDYLGAGNCVVSAPTASGKTLLALKAIAENEGKSVYVVPLRALATEKKKEFKEALEPFGLTVGLATGELDSSSEHLREYDVVVSTSEKLDSLFRHKAPWLKDVSLAVIDEVHLMGDGRRGATLEMVATKLLDNGVRVLALSATIPNDKDFADWLGARLVKSDYRPTPLEIGVCDGKELEFASHSEKISGGRERALLKKALQENGGKGQALVFVSSRRNAESLAKQLSSTTEKFLTEPEKEACEALAENALNALGHPTGQCRALADCMRNGAAFHHAGLVAKQRDAIERGFKELRCLKAIVCTTTLAMGLDYPASWVLVRDLKRFNGAFAEFIPALEAAQIVGRAGRPRYDDRGVGVLCCTPHEKNEVKERYLSGELEDVYSQLSSRPLLRGHCLGLIAAGHCRDYDEIYSFFEKTFFAHQYGDARQLFSQVDGVVGELKEYDFVREKRGLVATPVGKRVSELYIDPLTAASFISFIQKNNHKKPFDYLMELANATESRPLVRAAKNEQKELWEECYSLLEEPDLHDPELLDKYKSAKLLNAWINEATEQQIMDSFGLPPGVVHTRARNSEWLAYSLQEMAFALNRTRENAEAKRLTRRIKYGVKDELLELCSIRGIGRVRARYLWRAGVKTGEEYRALSEEKRKAAISGKSI